MTFHMPVLVNVLSARYTATEGIQDLEIIVTNHLGNSGEVTLPYTRDVREERLPDGRTYDLGLEIDGWFLAHPDFPIADYVPITPVIDPADNAAALETRQRETAKEEARALLAQGDTTAAFNKLLELIK